MTLVFRTEYLHPLMLSNVARNAKNIGVEIKNVDDWQHFLKDRDVNNILFSPGDPRYRRSGFFHLTTPIEEVKEEHDEA